MIKVLVDNTNWKEVTPIFVMHYRDMEMMDPGSTLLQKVRRQYASMARGGDGGLLDHTSAGWTGRCAPTGREVNYPDAPTEFFKELCDLLGWQR